jgi:hypothetical protein
MIVTDRRQTRPLVTERASHCDNTATFRQKIISGHKFQSELDTKMYWLTVSRNMTLRTWHPCAEASSNTSTIAMQVTWGNENRTHCLKDINMWPWLSRLKESWISESKICSWVLRDLDPKTTALARASSNCKP